MLLSAEPFCVPSWVSIFMIMNTVFCMCVFCNDEYNISLAPCGLRSVPKDLRFEKVDNVDSVFVLVSMC